MRDKLKQAGFTLVELMVAVTVFALIISGSAMTLVSIQQSWLRQKDAVNVIQNARWAMEFMANQIRLGTVSANPAWLRAQVLAGGRELSIGIDPDGDGVSPWQEIQYRAQGENLRMRWRWGDDLGPSGPWSTEADLTNLVADNPDLINDTTGLPPGGDGPDPYFIEYNGLVTIELTVRPRPSVPEGKNNRNYTLRTQVRFRN